MVEFKLTDVRNVPKNVGEELNLGQEKLNKSHKMVARLVVKEKLRKHDHVTLMIAQVNF